MKRFAKLYTSLDQTTKTTAKVSALAEYFAAAPPADAAWAIYFLSGGKMKRLIPMKLLRSWSTEAAGIETWMFDECYEIVGDLAELMALILPPPAGQSDFPLHHWITERLDPLRKMEESEQRQALLQYWDELDEQERFVLHKLITGSFRVGVSKRLVVQGLVKHSGMTVEVLSHRLMGNWKPTAGFYRSLLDPDTRDTETSRPYPFYLAHPLEQQSDALGDLSLWQVEWKWDGIRAQILKRDGEVFIWSRGEELMTERFPEIVSSAQRLPNGTVLDGEIVGWKDGSILPFSEIQRRIGRKTLGKKILADVPVSFIAFDLMEFTGQDVRAQSLDCRREKLESLFGELVGSAPLKSLQLSNILAANDWSELGELRQQSRAHQTEGLMLKRRSGPYRVGRPRGDWWKWKIEPYTIDAVLIYAQRGHGRRASLYTDYTFAVWDDERNLVPFAKAYSGLTDAEIRRVDQYVRRNTLERFGPVRSVTPQLVFELAFENIQESTRHKSGIAVRFPRINRWREDLSIDDADSLQTIKAMMNTV
jgi:DNA ligase-1